jgi:hypothetical protein
MQRRNRTEEFSTDAEEYRRNNEENRKMTISDFSVNEVVNVVVLVTTVLVVADDGSEDSKVAKRPRVQFFQVAGQGLYSGYGDRIAT